MLRGVIVGQIKGRTGVRIGKCESPTPFSYHLVLLLVSEVGIGCVQGTSGDDGIVRVGVVGVIEWVYPVPPSSVAPVPE